MEKVVKLNRVICACKCKGALGWVKVSMKVDHFMNYKRMFGIKDTPENDSVTFVI